MTLIELMIVVAIIAIISAVALPNYSAYVQRGRVAEALDGLSAYAVRMEQAYQDTGSYGAAGCTPTLPGSTAHFSFSCATGAGGASFTATATGSGSMSGYAYRINNTGTRTTVSHPKGVPPTACWSTRGTICDS